MSDEWSGLDDWDVGVSPQSGECHRDRDIPGGDGIGGIMGVWGRDDSGGESDRGIMDDRDHNGGG